MANVLDDIENAMKARLLEGTPPAGLTASRIGTYGAGLSDDMIAEEIERMANVSPACMILYDGGDEGTDVNDGDAWETAQFLVIWVAAAPTRETALQGSANYVGIYDLLKHGRDRLGKSDDGNLGYRDDAIVHPMFWRRNQRIRLSHRALTVAAYGQVFETLLVE